MEEIKPYNGKKETQMESPLNHPAVNSTPEKVLLCRECYNIFQEQFLRLQKSAKPEQPSILGKGGKRYQMDKHGMATLLQDTSCLKISREYTTGILVFCIAPKQHGMPWLD